MIVTKNHEGIFLRSLRGVLERLNPNRLELIILCASSGRQEIEQGFQALVEQRQPMLHALESITCRNRFVERVVGRDGAEMLHILLTEEPARLFALGGFRHRQQREIFYRCDCSLRVGIERADRFERVSKEIQPERRLAAWRSSGSSTRAGRDWSERSSDASDQLIADS